MALRSDVKERCLMFILMAFFCIAVQADATRILVGTSEGPPYMIKEGSRGIDLDITRAALKQAGYSMDVQFMTLEKAFVALHKGQLDATVPIFSGTQEKVFFSAPHVFYTPGVYSLSKNNLSIQSLADLKHYRIATFQGAKGYFGQEFAYIASAAVRYFEHSDMGKLVELLNKGAVDVVVLDYNIFYYYWSQKYGIHTQPEVIYHPVMKPVTASVGFYNRKVRDDFDQGLKAIKKDGSYRKILNQYQQYGMPADYPIP
ncbi:MAG: transporter substrate-binding domain-containing protein [Pseudomonadales bacterium]|nr:transporter substrate-binding domain-containing protein [Pseudomonadales bacterium]